jgi:hypothetical protein
VVDADVVEVAKRRFNYVEEEEKEKLRRVE